MSRNTMTRAHFQLIAETIRSARASNGVNKYAPRASKAASKAVEIALQAIAVEFSRVLRSTNTGFKADRFLDACDPAQEYRPKRKMGNQNSGHMTSSEISAYKKTQPDLYGGDLGTESGCNDD